MSGSKVSLKDETEVTTGAYYYTIIPGLLGTWLSRKISWTNLMKPITTRLTNLENTQGSFTSAKYENRSAPFTHLLDANSKVEAIDARLITGTPVLRVGTTLNGEQIFEDVTLTVGTDLNALINKSFPSSTTLYFGITGGAVNITIIIRNEIL